MAKNIIFSIALVLLIVSCNRPCEIETTSMKLPNSLFTDMRGIHNFLSSDSGLSASYNRSTYTSDVYVQNGRCNAVLLEQRSYSFSSVYLNSRIEVYYNHDSVICAIKPDNNHQFRYCLSHNTNIHGLLTDEWGKKISNLDSKISLDTVTDHEGFPYLLKFTVDEFGFIPSKTYIKEYYIEPTKGITNAKTLDGINWSFH